MGSDTDRRYPQARAIVRDAYSEDGSLPPGASSAGVATPGRRMASRPAPDAAWWGVALIQEICRGPIVHFQRQKTIVATALRCGGFNPLPIEIIARRKVTPTFEPEKGERNGGPQHPSATLWMLQVQPSCRAALVFNMRLAAIIRTRMSSD
jgi:hypothetical protein